MSQDRCLMNFKGAVSIAKLAHKTLNVFNSKGTSMPGKVLSKVCPKFLSEVKNHVSGELFVVTGTNGKTTTSGILAQILKEAGRKVIYNSSGANMPNGIITALALGFDTEDDIDNLVIESDEAYLKNVLMQLSFDYLILTNLFCDQTDRYSDPKVTASKIQEAVSLINPNLKLIVNADDPNLDAIGEGREKIFYGLSSVEFYDSDINTAQSQVRCGSCSRVLDYGSRYYSQLGLWSCACGRKRPKLDVSGKAKIFKDYSYLDVTYNDKNYVFKLKITGLYSVYNALAAISAALAAGVGRKYILKALDNYEPAFGREVRLKYKGKDITLYLVKNPAGANETLRKIEGAKGAVLLIAVNDQHADGRDVSWLWDTKFEALADFDNVIYLSGSRADDVALRLKYAHFDTGSLVINNDVKSALNEALNSLEKDERLIILTSYTPLATLQKILKQG